MDREINIQFSDVSSKIFTFKKAREFFEFINDEIKFWDNLNEKTMISGALSHELFTFSRYFGTHIEFIKNWNISTKNIDEIQFTTIINQIKSAINNFTKNKWLWSGHSYTSAFINCNKTHGQNAATAFINCVTKKQISLSGDFDNFTGSMLAYEFLNQDIDLVKRRNSEKKSLDRLRDQLQKANNTLFTEVEEFKTDLHEWDSKSRENWNTWIAKSESQHSTQQETHETKFSDNIDNYQNRIIELENLYQEKLRLEMPANYWKRAARRFGLQGGLWSLALLASLVLGVVYFSSFYGDWLKGQETAAKLNTVQGIIISGTVLATYAFLVRTLSRLTFSSFHLMRDAEEREQLTYLYLSLINENKIDESSRDIVLQALFSRSETGLLANESGPTMPSMSEIIRSASR